MNKHASYQQLRSHLAYLKLAAAAEQLPAALEHAEKAKPGYTQFLHDLLDVEVTATEQRRLAGRLRLAGFPSTKTLEEFDFSAQPSLDRRLVDELATLRFIEEKANVLAIGPPGVGKTMLAIALGLKAIHAGYRVYYTTAADLVARTSRAALEGRWQTTMRFWNGPQLLVIDELGYLPMPGEAAAHLFQVISRRQPRLRAAARREQTPDIRPGFRPGGQLSCVSAGCSCVLTSEQRLCRLAQEAADAQDPMRALETLVELGDELEVFTRAQVGRGLRDGRSFGDVARALGISRQAAHSRYRDLAAGPPAQSGQLAATEQALRVFRVAREEALTAKATAVGSEHVLIAVLRCGGDAARALVREGVTLETARACARGLAADRGRAAGAGRRRAGPRGVLRAAKRVTIARGERSLDVDAVLLGALADPHGGARRVLTVLAADVASIRRQLGGEPDAPSTPTRSAATNETRNGDVG